VQAFFSRRFRARRNYTSERDRLLGTAANEELAMKLGPACEDWHGSNETESLEDRTLKRHKCREPLRFRQCLFE